MDELEKKILDPSMGYTFSHEHVDAPNGIKMTTVNVHSPAGEHVGFAKFLHHSSGQLLPAGVGVEEEHQRKGIASAMYSHAQKLTNKPIMPAPNQTAEGQALWQGNAKLKQFGKSEDLETLEKTRPTPKFPKLGLGDDRRETPIVTPEQAKTKRIAMAVNDLGITGTKNDPTVKSVFDNHKNLIENENNSSLGLSHTNASKIRQINTNSYTHVGQPGISYAHSDNPEKPPDFSEDAHSNLRQQGYYDPAKGADYWKEQEIDPEYIADPKKYAQYHIEEKRRLQKEWYGDNYNRSKFHPNATKIHEDVHNMFVRVEQKYGRQGRDNLVHNLYHAIPKQYKWVLPSSTSPKAHGFSPDWANKKEEQIATLVESLNHGKLSRHRDRSNEEAPVGSQVDPSVARSRAYQHLLNISNMADEKWVKNRLFDDEGAPISFAKSEDLEKGWKGSLLGAAAMVGGLASQMKPIPQPSTPTSIQEPAKAPEAPTSKPVSAPEAPKTHPADMFESLHPDLHFISQLESSHGKNIQHAKNSKGDFHTAYGHLGFKPVSAFEIYNKAKDLKQQYPGLDSSDKFLKVFKENPKFYNEIASKFWTKLNANLGTPEKAAYGWRWGMTAAKNADPQKIASDGYVRKFAELHSKGALHKSEDFAAHISQWLEHRNSKQTDDLDHDYTDEDPIAAVHQMSGTTEELHKPIFEAARFLASKPPADERTIRRAMMHHEDNAHFAALYAYELQQTPENKKALEAILGFSEFSKSEKEEVHPHIITSIYPEAEDVAQCLQRAFAAGHGHKVNLKGKHSSHSMVAKDPETGRAYLLKPDDHKNSPAMGVADVSANQPVREALFYHVAIATGMYHTFPRAEVVAIDGSEWVAIKLLPPSFKNMGRIRFENPEKPKEILQSYLDKGIIYKWAILDMVLGNSDRHDGNIMVNPEGQVVLIDQGSALAGKRFNPGRDKNSFVPYYLRAWASKNFSNLSPVEKLKSLPKLKPETDKEVREWLMSWNINKILEIFSQYDIDPTPYINRLEKIKAFPGPIYVILNRAWSGVDIL